MTPRNRLFARLHSGTSSTSSCSRDGKHMADSPPGWKWWATASLLVLLAFLLRIYRIDTQELWLDEAYSYLLATAPDWFGPATLSNNTPPLYHFLLRGWIKFMGQGEDSLRLLSALFGVLFVAVVTWTGREMFTPSAGLWSGGFAAIAPIHVFYSQEARVYSLLILILAVTYVLIWRALQKNTRASW